MHQYFPQVRYLKEDLPYYVHYLTLSSLICLEKIELQPHLSNKASLNTPHQYRSFSSERIKLQLPKASLRRGLSPVQVRDLDGRPHCSLFLDALRTVRQSPSSGA